ncbi:hypothetical protein ACHAXS_003392 [Conticribra weissflogii]
MRFFYFFAQTFSNEAIKINIHHISLCEDELLGIGRDGLKFSPIFGNCSLEDLTAIFPNSTKNRPLYRMNRTKEQPSKCFADGSDCRRLPPSTEPSSRHQILYQTNFFSNLAFISSHQAAFSLEPGWSTTFSMYLTIGSGFTLKSLLSQTNFALFPFFLLKKHSCSFVSSTSSHNGTLSRPRE